MNASFVVLLPFGLLAIVSLLCFVGCGLDTAGTGSFYNYQFDVQNLAGNVALWPLDETSGTTASNNSSNAPAGTNGTYLATAVPYPDDSGDALVSAPAPGTFALGQPNIVLGDCLNGDSSKPSTCTTFDGGYVNMPANAAINPASFTIEAWVRPDWVAGDPPTYRVVMMSRNKDGGAVRGFSLYAKPDNSWAASVGDGVSPGETEVAGSKLIFGMINYLAATYDAAAQTLILYVDGFPSSKSSVTYAPNTTKPLYVGTGAPELPLRSSSTVNDPSHGPLNAFKGAIQDVAIYNRALTPTEIATNVAHGNQCATT